MGHLGEFGTPRPVGEDVTFGYFGHTIRANPLASDLSFIEFMDKAEKVEAVNEAQAIRVLMDYLRDLIHPEDWDTFWAAAKTNGQNSGDLMLVGQGVTAAMAGVPTGRPSDSSGGRPGTRRKSGGASSSRGTPTPRGRSKGAAGKKAAGKKAREVVEAPTLELDDKAQRALAITAGRPDLQMVVLDAAAARVGR